jgi:signal transduction histidine kinase
MVFRPVVVDLAQAVQSNMLFLQVRSKGKGIRIISDISPDTFVFADKEMLNLIIRNLISNAIKFTGFGGNIQVKSVHSEGEITVSVSDTGAGVPADQTDSLLRGEYSVSSEGTAGERGIGLGLTLCREFVRLNDGEIWFESAPSQGSTFYFTIPTPLAESAHCSDKKARRVIG